MRVFHVQWDRYVRLFGRRAASRCQCGDWSVVTGRNVARGFPARPEQMSQSPLNQEGCG